MREQLKRILLIFAVTNIVCVLVIAAIAIPNLVRSRNASYEAAAVQDLRVLNRAADNYYNTHKEFPERLATLDPTADPTGSFAGYLFRYEARDTDGDGLRDTYRIYASPLKPGRTGNRHFFTDQTGVIRSEMDAPADSKSLPIN